MTHANDTAALSVAIQGIAGCFHDEAAREYFAERSVTPCECDTFEQLAASVRNGDSDLGIMAIENTIAGPLLYNHELLISHGLNIVGEHKKRISHTLAALPGQQLGDITRVLSHPMALMQCQEFLNAPDAPRWHAVETFDTAGAARAIADRALMANAAICPALAADLYGLEILASGIETNKHNFTRFLIVTADESPATLPPSQANKASIVFTLPHTQGALSKVLTILSFYDLNLTKIQSLPIVGREWEYRFYVDLTFNDLASHDGAINAVRPLMRDFRHLGLYRESPTPAIDIINDNNLK